MRHQQSRAAVTVAAIAAWGLAVGGGFLFLGAYHARPGDSGAPTVRWPASRSLRPGGLGADLLMFVHPRCPCTPASLSELAGLATRLRGRFTPQIVLVKPSRPSDDWDQTPSERSASEIPEARVFDDRGGVEARRFGVTTSGHVLLFDADGRLVYSGGITSARGHRGGNLGLDTVAALISGRTSIPTEFPVFGCPLVGGEPESDEETAP